VGREVVGDDIGVEARGPLAGRRQADAAGGAGGGGHQAGAEQALEVDDEIEAAGPELAGEAEGGQ
jgi:hypothetical protein